MVNKIAGNTVRSLKKYEKKTGTMLYYVIVDKIKSVKFLTAFSLDNYDAFVFCVDFGDNFCILRLTSFKGTSESSVFFVENGSF